LAVPIIQSASGPAGKNRKLTTDWVTSANIFFSLIFCGAVRFVSVRSVTGSFLVSLSDYWGVVNNLAVIRINLNEIVLTSGKAPNSAGCPVNCHSFIINFLP